MSEPYDWKNDGKAVMAYREFKSRSESIAVEVDAFVETLDKASHHDPEALEQLVTERAKALRAELPGHVALSDQQLRQQAARALEPELITAARNALTQTETAVSSFEQRIAGWEEEAARVQVPEVHAEDIDLFHKQAILETRRVQRLLQEQAAREQVRELDLEERLELHATTTDLIVLTEVERQLRRQLAKPITDADLPAGLTVEQKLTTLRKLEHQRTERIATLDAAAAARIAPWKKERLAELRQRRDTWLPKVSAARQLILVQQRTGRISIDSPELKKAREQRAKRSAA